MRKKSESLTTLFLGTFVSMFLLMFGSGLLLIIFFPGLTAAFSPVPDHTLQLPLAENQPLEITPTPTPTPPPTQLFPPLTQVTQTAPGNWIRVPSLGVEVPLVTSHSLKDSDVVAALKNGAALYPNGVLPGHLGNVFVAGHSSGLLGLQGKYRLAFANVHQLEAGNVIHIDYNGARYTYKVTDAKIVKPTPEYRVVSDRPVPTLTLMTCSPLWSTANRRLTTAELTNVTQLTKVGQ